MGAVGAGNTVAGFSLTDGSIVRVKQSFLREVVIYLIGKNMQQNLFQALRVTFKCTFIAML